MIDTTQIRDWANWVAQDESGEVWQYEYDPVLGDDSFDPCGGKCEYTFTLGWEESKRKIIRDEQGNVSFDPPFEIEPHMPDKTETYENSIKNYRKILDEAVKAKDNNPLEQQIGGDHYQKLGDYQPWIVLSKWLTPEELKGAMKKDVIGYLARESDKGGRQDIEKAMHTLQIYLELTK